MFHHLLDFTDDDRANLKRRYHALVHKLEIGKDIEKHSLEDISESMRVVLQSQRELQPFLKQVLQEPAKHYHLHLMHSDKELLNLPWQLAIDIKQFPFVHITKGPVVKIALPVYQPQPGPLRILVMISSPENLLHDKRLSYEEEEHIILKALSPLLTTGQVQVHFTADGSLGDLKVKLQARHYHIVYISGHGIYKNNTGYLQLENPLTLNSEEINARDLANILKETPFDTPPLVILSSCQTAQGSMEEGFRGVADELIHEGVPAVIAMAFSIRDRFNILFVGHLYEQLAQKRPLAEAYSTALQDMRIKEQQELEIANRKQYHPSQWLIPQLYIGQQVDHIVNWQTLEQLQNPADKRLMEGGNGELLPHTADYRFVGRRRECALLLSELMNGKPVLITGQAGIGKTALAEYLVKRLNMSDAGYTCFVFNEKSIGISSMTSRLLHFLKTNDPHYEASYEMTHWNNSIQHLDFLVTRVSKYCKPVWVFDNLESFRQQSSKGTKDEYREWVNYLQQYIFSSNPLLFISRFDIPELKSVFTISLNQVLFVDYYRKCIQLNLEKLHTQLRLPELADIADLLYNLFGGNYRTLEFFNELYVNDQSKTLGLLQKIIELNDAQASARTLMKDLHVKMEKFSRGMVIMELINSLSQEEQKTLSLLLHFDRPVLPLALEMQLPGKNFDADLQRLKNLTLIEEQTNKETGHKLYYVAPLIKNSVEGIDLPQIYFYPEYAGDYHYKAFEILLLFNELESALEQYEICGKISKLNKAGVILINNYYKLGLYEDTLYYGEFVEEIAGDKTDGDILNNIGLALLKFGKTREALTYFTKFSILCRTEKDDKKLALAFNSIGQAHLQSGDIETGMEWTEKSIQLARDSQDSVSLAVMLNNLGLLYCELQDYDKAMIAYQESLDIRKRLNNRYGQVMVLNNICRIYADLGEHKKNLEKLEEAYAIAVEIEANRIQGTLLNNIGQALMEMLDYNAALNSFQKALAISQTFNDEEETGKALMNLGLLYRDLQKYDEAIECLTKSSPILQKYGHKDIHTEVLYQLGTIYIYRRDAAESLPFLQMALTEYRNAKNLKGMAPALFYIGEASLYLDEIDNAIKNLKECLAVLKMVEDKETEIKALSSLAEAYAIKGNPDKVLQYTKNSLALHQAAGNRHGTVQSLLNIAGSYHEKRQPDQYLKYALEAYTISAEANDLHELYSLSTLLGTFLCANYKEKYFKEGQWLLEQAYEIGLLSKDYPATEFVNEMKEELQQRQTKKQRRPGKSKSVTKKKITGKKKHSQKNNK